jgi:penicillin amidase
MRDGFLKGAIAMPVIVLVAALIMVLIVALYWLIYRPLPEISGTVRVKGLRDKMEVIRDRWGIPHIYAENEEDLFFAQGYVHAQDRLWQMEFHRRLASGTLAEIVGGMALEVDRFARIIGFRRAAQADLALLDEQTRRYLEAYSQGVNTFIEIHRSRLPLEFTLLRHKPAPWSLLDITAFGKFMGWALSCNWESELLRAGLIENLGPERAAELEPSYPEDNPTIIQSSKFKAQSSNISTGISYQDVTAKFLEEYRMATHFLSLGGAGAGSNNWVINGARSITGKPLLANDPHLPPLMPSFWYENHLVGGGLSVTGASMPGVPGVVLGHNDRIAWGTTNAYPDVQDLYIEHLRTTPSGYPEVEFQGEWERAQVVREEVKVRGRRKPLVEEVVITRHGPIISGLVGEGTPPLALRWVGHEPSQMLQSLNFNQARNWEEFVAGLRSWSVPAQNMVYADGYRYHGNIGYYMAGQVPIRARGLGLIPVPGWTGEYEWTGYIPFEELPQVHNPPIDYIASANNKIVGDDYPYFLTLEPMPGYRARRIVDLIEAKEKLSIEDFQAMQLDLYSIPAEELVPHILALQPDDEWCRQAVEHIRSWDRCLTADSVAAAIYEVFEFQLLKLTFADKLGELADTYFGAGRLELLPITNFLGRSAVALRCFLQEGDSAWFADGATGQPRTREKILLLALEETVSTLRGELGDDMERWQWGRLHQTTFTHLFGRIKPLHLLFNRGPFPTGGDSETVWQASGTPGFPFSPVAITPTYRQIIDLGDWERSVAVNSTGQSGQLGSRHYADMIELWRTGRYHPMLWERASIEREAEGTLILLPQEGAEQ